MRMQHQNTCSHYISSFRETSTVDYATSNGTAPLVLTTASSGRITFSLGVTSQNIPVTILADAVDEVNET